MTIKDAVSIMPPKMTAVETNKLRYEILVMCDTADGKTGAEIMQDPSIAELTAKFAKVTIMSMVRALVKSDLLRDSGGTHGNLYYTTKEGQDAAQRFKPNTSNE